MGKILQKIQIISLLGLANVLSIDVAIGQSRSQNTLSSVNCGSDVIDYPCSNYNKNKEGYVHETLAYLKDCSCYKHHAGIDYLVSVGNPVYAVADEIVYQNFLHVNPKSCI